MSTISKEQLFSVLDEVELRSKEIQLIIEDIKKMVEEKLGISIEQLKNMQFDIDFMEEPELVNSNDIVL